MRALNIRMSCVDPAAVCNDTLSTNLGWPIVALVLIALIVCVALIISRVRRNRRRRTH